MPRKAKELTDVAVRNLKKPGYYAVGGSVSGLLLQVTATGARSWVLRYTAGVKPGTGKPWRRDLGLGGYPDVSLSEARRKAAEARELLSKNIDPITAKREARSAMLAARLAEITFEKAAHQFIESKSAEWKSGGKSADQWTSSLEAYAFPVLGSLRVADIDRAHVLRVLEPIWTEKNETANRVRQRMESVLDWAKVRGFREGDNPARWKGYLDKVLPAPGKVRDVQHHPALPYAQMQLFMVDLRSRNGMGARALEFAILTAARSGEARGARWDEIDLDAKVWTVPPERMKSSKKEHRVPLSDAVIKMLKALPRVEGTDLVFTPQRGSNPLSDNTLTKLLGDMHDASIKRGGAGYIDPKQAKVITAHGFRSTFRDWASEETHAARDVVEMALAHTIGNKVEAAYRRGDLFEKRRALMTEWATFCSPKSKVSS